MQILLEFEHQTFFVNQKNLLKYFEQTSNYYYYLINNFTLKNSTASS